MSDLRELRCGASIEARAVDDFIELVLLRRLRDLVEDMLDTFARGGSFPIERLEAMRSILNKAKEAD